MKRFKSIFNIFTTITLWHISFWKIDLIPVPFHLLNLPGRFYLEWLYPNKIYIGIVSGLALLLIQFDFRNPFKIRKRKILKSIQDHYINDIFQGENEKNRITIFKVKRGYKIICKYVLRCFIKSWSEHRQKKLFLFYLKNLPIPYSKYLVQYSRNGHPYPKGSSTIFKVPANEQEISGIVAESFYKSKAKKISLPVLDSKKVCNITSLKNYSGNEKTKIKKYMLKGKINSFDKFKSFHRYPSSIYAEPIILDNETQWGCIVFDSIDEKLQLDDCYKDFINYSKIVKSVISNLN